MDIIKEIEQQQLRTEEFDFHVGDTIAVSYLIKEGTRERIYPMGLVISAIYKLLYDNNLQVYFILFCVIYSEKD